MYAIKVTRRHDANGWTEHLNKSIIIIVISTLGYTE